MTGDLPAKLRNIADSEDWRAQDVLPLVERLQRLAGAAEHVLNNAYNDIELSSALYHLQKTLDDLRLGSKG